MDERREVYPDVWVRDDARGFEVVGVEEEDTFRTRSGKKMFSGFGADGVRIVLVGRKLIKFGNSLGPDRREAMIDVLRGRLERE